MHIESPDTACPVSIFVPFYNEISMVDMAIASIRAQRIARLQTILVNDNPEAFPLEYFNRFCQMDGVEVLHHQQNLGLSVARNTGMEAARGAYIGFLDAR